MHTDDATYPAQTAQTLHVELCFDLRLTRDGPAPNWRAVLEGTESVEGLRFETLTELVRYLARLELSSAPPRGIR